MRRAVLPFLASLSIIACNPAIEGDRSDGGSAADGGAIEDGADIDGSADDAGNFVLIDPGTFTMGAPEGALVYVFDEQPQHQVTLTHGFYLQRTEVTQAEWTALFGSAHASTSFKACGGSCPVDTATWWEAAAFANALSTSEGLPECMTLDGCMGTPGAGLVCTGLTVNAPDQDVYRCTGYRLPTEAEWEYAYRAGTVTDYYNGDMTQTECAFEPKLVEIGWYCNNSGNTTHPVGQKLANPWGLFDMSGNVSEWCWDNWSSPYSAEAVVDPAGPPFNFDFVIRGGGFVSLTQEARASWRTHDDPGNTSDSVGFRLARTRP